MGQQKRLLGNMRPSRKDSRLALLCVLAARPSQSFQAPLVTYSGCGHIRGSFRPPGSRWLSSKASTSMISSQDQVIWTTDKVRSTFIDYFQNHQHTHQASSPCAPLNDPTLLFTNAGMNQFKPIFLGRVDPSSTLATLKRACNSQKCLRAGGKHNDLEDVGRDTYHHTFFEMLGSWSFGDYFKKEAIDFAWELLTTVYKLDPDRLYATYFAGNDQVPCDTEARDYWLQYIPPHRVIACDAKDNFWEMGDVGPCGPCSELHYDRIGGGRDASALVNADDPDVIEIWNLVFIQFNREKSSNGTSTLQPLPAKHIDTGMGLERLVSVLQDKPSNYDIDCFQPIFDKLCSMTAKKEPYTGRVDEDVGFKDTAFRAIADHARALAFAIADGAVPNNEGRGYVLRRILRRAARYGQQILKCQPGFMAELVPVVIDTFGDAYPELRQQQEHILSVVKEEEDSFSSMLDRGIKYFSDLEEEMKGSGSTIVEGSRAFYLYDTLGFPIDLTELMAKESGLTVNISGFNAEMEAQKNRSRQAQKRARSGNQPDLELQAEQTSLLTNSMGILPTDDSKKYGWDVSLRATVMAMYTQNGIISEGTAVSAGESFGVILDKSSFYSEAGGQESDSGLLEVLSENGDVVGRFAVADVQACAGFLLHKGVHEEGSTLQVGSAVSCRVDYDRRRKIAPNHSMTHILNWALRQVLGDSVDQRGSLSNEEKLRFDFSHKKALSSKELKRVEELCQQAVDDQLVVTSEVMPLAQAKEIEGVRAVFGEVYPDPVRVVTIGDSVELCGGTHVLNTADAEAFCLVEETAVAKGIRRITAVTKDTAIEAAAEGRKFTEWLSHLETLGVEDDLDEKVSTMRKEMEAAAFVSASLKSDIRSRMETLQKKTNDTKKKALQKRIENALVNVKEQVDEATTTKTDQRWLVLSVDISADSKASQSILNAVKKMSPDLAFLGISSSDDGKVLVFANVPDRQQADGFKANEWVLAALEPVGGRGGGRAGMAQGQARDCTDVSPIAEAASNYATAKSP